MAAIYSSPGKYVQGPGVLENLGQYVRSFGGNALVLTSSGGKKRFGDLIEHSVSAVCGSCMFVSFDGECSCEEIGRLTALAQSKVFDVIVGVGGGKVFDTAKAIAHYVGLPVIVCPTVASTDAPCSALSAIYSKQGIFEKYLVLKRNPDVVLVDTAVITASSLRLTVAGMGDALSTYFEARACVRSGSATPAGGSTSHAALAFARLCYDTLMADGLKAKKALKQKQCIDAVERVIEANTLLSGIGFESGGLAAAHAMHNGLTGLEDCQNIQHGEKVAFGTLAQLVLERETSTELAKIVKWCVCLGLPVTLAELGVTQAVDEKIMCVAQTSCAPNSSMSHMPFPVTPALVYNAILEADTVGRKILND